MKEVFNEMKHLYMDIISFDVEKNMISSVADCAAISDMTIIEFITSSYFDELNKDRIDCLGLYMNISGIGSQFLWRVV
jgi:hypothetical protein